MNEAESENANVAALLPWSRASLHEVKNPLICYHHKSRKALKSVLSDIQKLKGTRERRKSTFSIKETDNKKLNKTLGELDFTTIEDSHCKSMKATEAISPPIIYQDKEAFPKPSAKYQDILVYQKYLTKDLIKSFKELSEIKLPSETEIAKRQLEILKKEKRIDRKILLLDLDETLLHVLSHSESKKIFSCYKERVKEVELLNNGEMVKVRYLTRPYLQTFLEKLTVHYDIWVNTIS
jgi:hypothetical protein